MRTLKLTHEEIELIQRALGIAEIKFNDLRENYIQSVINVRGINSGLVIKEADIFFEKANEFADLLLSIKFGEKDV